MDAPIEISSRGRSLSCPCCIITGQHRLLCGRHILSLGDVQRLQLGLGLGLGLGLELQSMGQAQTQVFSAASLRAPFL